MFSMASLQASLPSISSIKPLTAPGKSCSMVQRSLNVTASPFSPMSGLSRSNPLQLGTEITEFSSICSNGSRLFAMRHGKRIARLGRPADQRKALLRGLTTEILRHGRIKTTLARAKAMRKFVEHIITLAKSGTLHDRRQAVAFVYDTTLVHAVFADAPERYAERNGGYTRIVRTMPRKGDNAPMAFIELV